MRFCKCHQSKDVDVNNIPENINPSDIFLKEIKDNTHFKNTRDLMMVSLQEFLNTTTTFSHILFPLTNYFPTIPYGRNTWFQTVYNSKQVSQNTLFQQF